MAGEIVVHPFNEEMYVHLVPALRELNSARRLGDDARRTITQALPDVDAGELPGIAIVRRILAVPSIDPRAFLDPRELRDAIEHFVLQSCFQGEGEYSFLDPCGPDWVVLDEVLQDLSETSWFGELFRGTDETLSFPAAYPTRGEGTFYVVTRDGLDYLLRHLDAMLADSPSSSVTNQTIDALHQLGRGAAARRGWTLAYRALL